MAAVGKSSGAGRPPPNEITSGCWVTLSISRIVDARRCAVRWANCAAREIVGHGVGVRRSASGVRLSGFRSPGRRRTGLWPATESPAKERSVAPSPISPTKMSTSVPTTGTSSAALISARPTSSATSGDGVVAGLNELAEAAPDQQRERRGAEEDAGEQKTSSSEISGISRIVMASKRRAE